MTFAELTLKDFTERLSSSAPVPGGGGATALTAAEGIALGEMVGSLTVGKKRYASVEEQMKRSMERAASLRELCLGLVDRDAEAFFSLSEIYKLPKEDPERGEKLEAGLRMAAEPPMRILTACCEALDELEQFAQYGSTMVISDASTGALLCDAAMKAAWINVQANTRLMKDREAASGIENTMQEYLESYGKKAETICEIVQGRLIK